MDWEELENILRSRQVESTDTLLWHLLEAIGRQLSYDMVQEAVDQLWLGHYSR